MAQFVSSGRASCFFLAEPPNDLYCIFRVFFLNVFFF